MRAWTAISAVGTAAVLGIGLAAAQEARHEPPNVEQLFRTCAACHSLEPGRHMTGPSLAGIFGRRAGTAEGFSRYSEALQAADIVWNEETLDAWLADPAATVPGNMMAFPGIRDREARAALIAFLKEAAEGRAAERGDGRGGDGAMGGMAGGQMTNLAEPGPEQQVAKIAYCGDTYRITMSAGETLPIWEFNLRIKTDSSDMGPPEGRPALVRAGMMGDRYSVIFAGPQEISGFIKEEC